MGQDVAQQSSAPDWFVLGPRGKPWDWNEIEAWTYRERVMGSQSSNFQVGNTLLDQRFAESSLDTPHHSGQDNQCSFQVSLENPSDPSPHLSAFFTSPPLQLWLPYHGCRARDWVSLLRELLASAVHELPHNWELSPQVIREVKQALRKEAL